ncbi:MAG: hypothetical protein HOP29_04505 [Phycisphaerales bacterium]|nr:hypothetical protein [Phycisphaerales bacterium]
MPADRTIGLHKHRAALCSAAMLAGVTGLASLMVNGQHDDVPLGAGVRPDDWDVSFQPPADWRRVPGSDYGVLDALVFVEPEVNHARRLLFVGRRRAFAGGDVEGMAAAFIHDIEYQGILAMLIQPRFQVIPRFGASGSSAVQDPRKGTIAIATDSDDRWAYCAAMSFEGRESDRGDLGLLEKVIRSIERAP